MPYVISALVFIFISVLSVPSTWFEANVVRKRLMRAPKEVSARGIFSIKRVTPLVINIMTMLNINLSIERHDNIETDLQLGGQGERLRVEDFITIKVILGLVLPLYFLFLGAVSSTPFLLLLALLMIPAGYFVPDQWLKAKIKKRQAKIKQDLPNALNSIAVMSEAGLNLMPAIQEFASKEESALSRELRKVVQDVSVGESQMRALEHMAERCQVDEVNRFVSALSQNIERGSSGITAVLRNMAAETWEERKKNAQQLGEQASMKLFFPLLVLAFPATAIFILGPAIINIMEFLL